MSPNVTTDFATEEIEIHINNICRCDLQKAYVVHICMYQKNHLNVYFFALKSFWDYTCNLLFTSIYN